MTADVGQRPLLQIVGNAEHDRPALVAGDVEGLAHILVHALRAVRRDVMGAGRGGERRLLECLVVPFGVHRRFAGEHDQGNAPARGDGERRHDLREARPAGDGGDADLSGREVIAHGHGAGAMLVPGAKRPHAVEILHGARPMHVAVAHEREVGVDAFRREGLGQSLIDGQVFHWGCSTEEISTRSGILLSVPELNFRQACPLRSFPR